MIISFNTHYLFVMFPKGRGEHIIAIPISVTKR